MPSSPEAVPLQLVDLASQSAAGAAVRALRAVTDAPAFTPTAQAAAASTPAPLFEVGRELGVPDHLLEQARAQARAAGYLAGWTEGRREAEARARDERDLAAAREQAALAAAAARCEQALAAVATAAAALHRRSAPVIEQLEGQLVAAALEIAEALVGHALRDDAARAAGALARTLALVPDDTRVEVRLHPDDLAVIDAATVPAGVTLVADATLVPGDATASSAAGEVDARLAAAVARVRDALL